MSRNKDGVKENSTSSQEMRFFKKITAIPYLLVLLALLMPLATVSCTGANVVKNENSAEGTSQQGTVEMVETVLVEPSLYQLAMGVNLSEDMTDAGKEELKKFEKGAMVKLLKSQAPDFPKMPPMTFLTVILIGAILAGVFAWITPLGSITMGMLTMVSMSYAVAQISSFGDALNLPVIKVVPGIGFYAAEALILIGTAMNLASIIRPIVTEYKARRAAKKSKV